jgi:dCMP deaminase
MPRIRSDEQRAADKQRKLDKLWMDIAKRLAKESHAERKKVGCVIVKDDNILSTGWNGTPSGDDNSCEIHNADGTLTTKPEVLHAELNALMKLAAAGDRGSAGATAYVTLSPCSECAKMIKQAKISRVVYGEQYRISDGVDFLRTRGINVEKL